MAVFQIHLLFVSTFTNGSIQTRMMSRQIQKQVCKAPKVNIFLATLVAHRLSKVANMVFRSRISQIQTKLIRPKVLYIPLQCYNGNQLDWLFSYFYQIFIKYFHCFHASKVMFWPANWHFVNDAVSLTFQSIWICKYIVNICPKVF